MSSRKLPRHVHTPEELGQADYSQTIARDWIPQLDWTRMAFQTWAEFTAFITLTAINSAGAIATGAINALAQIVNGLFTADATGRAKFQDLFVTTAIIDNLAVTTAKIDSLAVTGAKIANATIESANIKDLAVTSGKIEKWILGKTWDGVALPDVTLYAEGEAIIWIHYPSVETVWRADRVNNLWRAVDYLNDVDRIASGIITGAKIANATIDTANIKDLAVTSGKINDLAVTNIKIANGTLEIGKCTSEFSQYSYFEHNRWITSIEALTGYQVSLAGAGAVTTRKNYLKVTSGATAGGYVQIKGYPIVDPAHNPKIKCRVRITAFPTETSYVTRTIDVGIGDFAVAVLCFRFTYDVSGNKKIYAYSYNGTTPHTVELQSFALNTWYVLEIRKQGANVLFRIDNVDKTTISADLPTTMMEDSQHYAQADMEAAGAVEFEECYMTVTEDWM